MKKRLLMLFALMCVAVFSICLLPVRGEAQVYDTVVPRSIRLSEAPSHGKPGIIYDRFNRGSRAYMELAEEFIKRSEGGEI